MVHYTLHGVASALLESQLFILMFQVSPGVMLDIEELTESDISGKPSSNDVECNKILSNGNHLKAKILFIDEERFVIAYSLIGPNVHDSDVTELTKVYDSAVYKK